MRRICLRHSPSMRSFFGSRRMTLSVLSRNPHKIAALTAFDSTVAIATPSTLMWSTAAKKRFRITFRTPEAVSAISGIFVSPTLRKTAASKL